jgi:hypothetical protein
MPKQERNKQFVEIEKKISTYLSVQKKIPNKDTIHFDEFEELKEITRQIALERGLSLSEWFRWLNYRYLSVYKYIPVEVEKYEFSSLDFTEEKKYAKVPPSQNGLRVFKKIFGTDLQRKTIEAQDASIVSPVS